MNLKIIAWMLVASIPYMAKAQQTLSGTITSTNGAVVKKATIELLNSSDSSIYKTATADNKGRYSFVADNITNKILKIDAPGYVLQAKTIAANDTVLNFVLSPIKALSEVTVTDRKRLIEQKADRTVFNVENSVSAQGGDALGALKKTPGVQVIQNQVTIVGKSGVSIMVNGRLQQLTGDELMQFLHSIPADNLSKIEVITSPGARYDAEGNSGIINLVTKKNLKQGLRGSVTGAYSRNSYGSPSGSASLQYRTGKLNLYTNDNADVWNWVYTNRAKFYYPDIRWEQTINQEYGGKSARAQVGADYILGKNSTIGVVYSKGFGGSDNKEHIQSAGYVTGIAPDSVERTEGTTHEVYKGKHTLNLNYEWRIDSTGKKLNIDADYFTQSTERERNFEVKKYVGDGNSMLAVSDNRILSDPSITIRSAKADLELPYSFARLSLGAKASFVNNDGSFTYLVKTGEAFAKDSSKSNRFLYDEQIQAAYLTAQKNIAGLDIQAGLRLEHTHTKGYTPATGQTNETDYTQLFPSLSLGYKADEKNSYGFTYTRRVSRPGYNFLNPFRFYYTPNSYTEGNPNLKPSTNNVLELSWFMESKYYVRLRTAQISNYWDRLIITDNTTGTSSTTRVNIGKAALYSASFGFAYNVTKWWEFRGDINGQYSSFSLNGYGSENSYSGYNGWINVSNTFYLNKSKTIIAELNGYYYTPRQKDYKLWAEMSDIDGGIKAMFLNKCLTIGINFEDPFQKAYWFQTNKLNGATEYSYDDGRFVCLTVSYKFGNKNIRAKRERSEAIEEIQRAK